MKSPHESMRPRRLRGELAVAGVAVLLWIAPVFTTRGQAAEMISVNHEGTESGSSNIPTVPAHSGYWSWPLMSADGRYVVFGSYAGDLVDIEYLAPEVFVRDRQTNTTFLVNVTPDGTPGNGRAHFHTGITPDGRYVAFRSHASNLVPEDPNGLSDIYVRDLQQGTTTLVSANDNGEVGEQDSWMPTITDDGRFVAFYSASDNLVTLPTPSTDVYVRDLVAGTTELVSINVAGTAGGNNWSNWAAIAAGGRYVVFSSNATDLVEQSVLTPIHLYVRDTEAGTTELVDINMDGTATGNGNARSNPHITPDGRYVLFASGASDLVPGDTNGVSDLFVRDRVAGTTTLVSVNAAGTGSGNGESGEYQLLYGCITPDGRYVVFRSAASDLTSETDANGSNDVFLRDLVSGTTTLVSVEQSGTAAGNGSAGGGFVTTDGRFVFFSSSSSNLVDGDTNGEGDVFVRDIEAGTTRLLSTNLAEDAPGNAFSEMYTAPTPDGNNIAFLSLATDLSEVHDPNEAVDVFVVETGIGQATAVSDLEGTSAVRLEVIGSMSHPGAELDLYVPGEARVEIGIIDVAGRRVASVWRGQVAQGARSFRWDGLEASGRRAPSGVYFARAHVRVASQTVTRSAKIVLLR